MDTPIQRSGNVLFTLGLSLWCSLCLFTISQAPIGKGYFVSKKYLKIQPDKHNATVIGYYVLEIKARVTVNRQLIIVWLH